MAKTWFEEGEEKGMEKGIEKGELKGRREFLLYQLEVKFPGSSSKARQRVAEWPVEKIMEAARTLLTAQSLKDLGLED